MKIFLFLQLLFLLLFFQTTSCNHQEVDPIIKWKGLDNENDIVFLFKKNTTYKNIEDFKHNVLYKPYVEGYGRDHQDGIADLTVGIKISDFEGGFVNFSKDATFEQRKKLATDIESSPIIYKVYENIVPNEIKNIDETE